MKALYLLLCCINCSSYHEHFCGYKKVLGDCVCNGEDDKICSPPADDQGCIKKIVALKPIKYSIVDLTRSMFEINSFDNLKCDKLLINGYIPDKSVDFIFSKAMSKTIQNILYIEDSTKFIVQSLLEKGAPNMKVLKIYNDYSLPSLKFDNLPDLELLKLVTFDSIKLIPRVFSKLRHLKKLEIQGTQWLTIQENSLEFQSENLLHVDFSYNPIDLQDLKISNLSNELGGLVADLKNIFIQHFPQDVFERFFKKNSNIEVDLDDNRIICSYKENKWIYEYEGRKNKNFPVKNVKCANYGSKNLLSMEKCEFKDYDKIDTDCSPTTKLTTLSTTNKVTNKTNPNTEITTSTTTSPTSPIPLSTSTISSTPINPVQVEKVNVLQNYLIFIILGVIFVLMVIFRLYFHCKKYFTGPNNQDIIRIARGSSSNSINPDYNTSTNYLTQSQIDTRNIYSRVRKYLRIFHFNEILDRPLPQIESSNAQMYSIEGQMDIPEEHIYETINYNNIYETIE